MVMDTLQIRMNKELIKRIDNFVKLGVYSNRADVIRDAFRRFVWEKEVGSIPNKGNAVRQVRKIREALSKNNRNFQELNEFGKLV